MTDDDLGLSPAKDIPAKGMAVAVSPILFVALVSLYLKLGNVQTLLIAATRCVAQLLLLGLILYPILRYNKSFVVLPYILIMILFATREASVKPKLRYQGMRLHMLTAIILSVSVSLTVICFGVLQPDPWHDAQVVIPVAGMMLGSCVNALSLGMDRFLLAMRGSGQGSAQQQTLLACGATRWETSIDAVRQAIETGLTPNLNQMSVMGLVSIPGMYTGQILAGTPPLLAAKYQIVIMFFVCSNSTSILFLTILQAIFFRLFDQKQCRFRAEIIDKRQEGKPKDIVQAFLTSMLHLFQSIVVVAKNKTNTDGEEEESQKHDVECHHSAEVRDTYSHGTFQQQQQQQRDTRNGCCLLKLTQGTISYGDRERRQQQKDRPPLLSNLNLKVHQGDIIVLAGPSGCGKSSYLRALALLDPLEKGNLAWCGSNDQSSSPAVEDQNDSNQRHLSVFMWRCEVLYVRQNGGQGLQGTPKELLTNLCALQSQSSRHRRRRSRGRQQSSGNDDHFNVEESFLANALQALDLPAEIIDRRWDLLSGGEAQRVYLCVMLALRPSILLLDEPTSACDEQATRKVEEMIVGSGTAALWVSHDPAQMERLLQCERASCMRYQALP